MRSSRLAAVGLFLFAFLVGPAITNGQGTLISTAARRDIIFDHGGHYLYITTSDGFVQRYNLASSQLDSPFHVGGSLNGADIPANDSFLLIAQEQLANGQGRFQKLDLTTGVITDIPYSPNAGDGEAGGYAVAIAANGIALATTERQAQTSGGNLFPLRAINLASSTISIRQDVVGVAESTEFKRSADAHLLFTGGLLTYSSETDKFATTKLPLGSYSTTIAMNRNNTLLARSTQYYGGSMDTAANLTFVRSFRELNAGVVFDPTRDVLYGVDSVDSWIIGYDAKTLEVLFRLDIGEYLGPFYSLGGFGSGRLAISPDGRYLALSTPTGVRLFTIPSPPYATPAPPDLGEPRGVVFDHTSKYLYVTTTTGFVLAFNVATTILDRMYNLGGWLYGIDIAADDSFLLVAQAYPGIKQGAIQKLNIATGAITNLNYDRVDWERGAYDIHFASNNRAFFSTTGDATPARQIDLSNNTLTIRDEIRFVNGAYLNGGLQIQRSADGTLLYFLEPNSSGGATFTYRSATDTLGPAGDVSTYFDLTNAAVNRDGTLAALRFADDVHLQAGPDFHTIHVFPDFNYGVAFNAIKDVLYAVSSVTDEIIAYDTNTFAELSRMWIADDLTGASVGTLFGLGSLVASQDGRYLALFAPSGIQLIDLQNPPGPRPNFTIITTTSPPTGGTVSGGGVYPGGADVGVSASANRGYVFSGWTENGANVSASGYYTFKAYSNRTLIANFQPVLPIVATPALSPNGGTFKKKIKVSASCATAGASIVYTTDGSDPDAFSARWPKRGLQLTGKGPHTVKAKAVETGHIDSPIVSATFTIR
jgi:hypothetical protein